MTAKDTIIAFHRHGRIQTTLSSTAINLESSAPSQRGYALARLLSKLPSLNGTFAEPKSVFVNAVRAAAVRLSQAISGCWPPRELVKPSLERTESQQEYSHFSFSKTEKKKKTH
jgi:hypothetical protein